MKLFQGLNRTDYQDVLRALGLFLDDRGYRNIRLIEHEDGIIVQGTPTKDGTGSHHYETVLLTDEDLQHIMHSSYDRRQKTGPLNSLPTGQPLMRGQRPTPPF